MKAMVFLRRNYMFFSFYCMLNIVCKIMVIKGLIGLMVKSGCKVLVYSIVSPLFFRSWYYYKKVCHLTLTGISEARKNETGKMGIDYQLLMI